MRLRPAFVTTSIAALCGCALHLLPGVLAASSLPALADAERLLDLLSPDQAEAFAAGADPEGLILDDGRSLAEHLEELAGTGAGSLVFVPVDSCSLLRTTQAIDGKMTGDEIRAFLARGETTDLSDQGGNPAGCGIPNAAIAVMMSVTVEQPDGTGRLKGWPVDAPQPGGDLLSYRITADNIAFFSLAVVGLCDLGAGPCAAGDFNFRAVTSGTHVRAEAAGFYVPAIAEVAAGDGLLGGGTEGVVTLDVDPTAVQSRVTGTCPAGSAIAEVAEDGTVVCEPDDDTLAALSCALDQIAKWDGAAWVCADDETGDVTDIWVDEAGDTMTGTLDMGGNPISAVGDLTLENGSNVFKGGQLFISEDLALDSVSLGRGALEANVSGGSSTAVGNQALSANTTGSDNTATGAGALSQNTTGFNNTALGAFSLLVNTIGYQNTAIGADALRQNTTGYRNTASGESAMADNETGHGNTATGEGTLQFNTAGNHNTAGGYRALRYNSTGSRNIGIGYRAGYNATYGDDNVFIANEGAAGESGRIRIGTQGTQTATYVAGISGTPLGGIGEQTPEGAVEVVVVNGTGQLGTATGAIGDADTLDGLDSGQLLRSDASDSFDAGILTTAGGTTLDVDGALDAGGATAVSLPAAGISGAGAGSGLDADLLDGLDSSAFLTTGTDLWVDEAGDTMTGMLDMGGNPISAVGDLTLENGSAVFKGGQLFISEDLALNSVSLGRGALEANVSGSSNTAVGNSALVLNTTGSNNTAIGLGAGAFNTDGSNNTAVGAFSLQANTTGGGNTATGSFALVFNTSGIDNTATGSFALGFNTTGSYNTADGVQALRANTTGYRNTAVGVKALRFNYDGFENTAVGHRAMYDNLSGYSNSAVGDYTLAYNTSGNFNTALGMVALRGNTTGSRNIALGFGAGVLATTGSNNIWIGNYGTAGEANTLRIGMGTGSGAFQLNRAYVSGIYGIPVSGSPVVVDSNGQLGVAAGPAGDADTLDGLDSTQFLRSDSSDSFDAGTLTTGGGTTLDVDGALDAGGATAMSLPAAGISGAGPGSGLDADLLDGLDSSAFLTAGTDLWVDEAGDTMSGTLDMGTNPITGIGAVGTEFTAGGGLTLADDLTLQTGETISNTTDEVVTFSDGTDTFDIDLSGSVILRTGDAQQPLTVRLGTTSALDSDGAPLVLEGGTGQFTIETTGIPGGRIELEGGKHVDFSGECALPNGNNCSGHARIAGGSATGNTCTAGGSVVLSGGSGNCGWGDGNVVVPASNFGIGTYRPDTQLHVEGGVKIVDGTQGAGKVLTSDADGLASWAAVPGLPAGAIIMWSGTLASIPAGWALCDGTNGTPDLRNRFIYGVDSGEDPGATGGADSYSLTAGQLPGHTHPFSTNSAGSHTHDLRGNQTAGSTDFVTMLANSAGAFENRMDPAGDHSHSGTTDATGSGDPIDNRPAYVKLAFIMKL